MAGLNDLVVFWDLAELKAGDEIIVEDASERFVFRVRARGSVDVGGIEVSTVFGSCSSPELMLLTVQEAVTSHLGLERSG